VNLCCHLQRGLAVKSMSMDDLQQMIGSVPHWYHQFEFAPGVLTPGTRNSRDVLAQLNLPQNMAGMRVLDIGARDGFFSFECERRGATEVVPLDYIPAEQTGFPVAKRILGSSLNLIHDNIYNLTSQKYGYFDMVLMLGLFYHLPDPMRALDIVFSLMKPQARLYLETIVIDEQLPAEMARRPFMLFYPKSSKDGDHTNYWGMTEACVVAMLQENNFAVLNNSREGERGAFQAIKSGADADYYLKISRGLVE